jgi:basic membrane protein A
MMKLFKKLVSVGMVAVLALSLGACGKKTEKVETTTAAATEATTAAVTETTAAAAEGYELALITDVGTIDDKSFNQGAWEGVEAYAKEAGKTYKYYKPTEKSDTAYINSIDLAIKGGAKVVVCPGFLFEVPIFNVQKQYPDVNFIILDGAPHNGDYKYDIAKNTYSIFYAEQEAGFLAGYSIVKEGYTKLGFMGGMAVPAVVRYGYGFIQGANYAAKELGLTDKVQLKYTYVGNFDATPENQAKASSWYNEGTEVIFACGGAVGNSVMKAAESAGKKVIGVDVDQSTESDTVITSSMKNLKKSVYDALTSYYAGTFPGGTTVSLDATAQGVELPMATSRFAKFTQADYDAIYAKVVAKEVTLVKDTDASGAPVTVDKVPAENVKVEVIE